MSHRFGTMRTKLFPLTSSKLSGWWGVCCFIALFAQSAFFSHLLTCTFPERWLGLIAVNSGDRHSYTGAMDHLIEEGKYYFINMRGEEVMAGRMPHYAIPYFILRLVTLYAADICVFLQIALFAFAVWTLANLLVQITGKQWIGLAFLLLGGLSGHLTPSLLCMTPESVSYALVALAMHRFWLTEQRDSTRDRWILGVIMGLLIVVKPYYALLLPLIALRWLYKTQNFRKTFRFATSLVVPVLMLLAPWWVRNAVVLGRFFPFQQDIYAGYGYPETELRLRSFAQAMGEDGMVWWNPYSMASAFRLNPMPASRYQWPDYMSPEMVQGLLATQAAYKTVQLTPTERNTQRALNLMDSVQTMYARQYPWRYHLFNRFHALPELLVYSGSAHLPVHASNPCYAHWQLALKIAASAAYWFSLLGLVLGLVILPFHRNGNWWLWLAVPVYLVVLFGLVFRAPEWRYFSGAFLIDVWVALFLVHLLWERFMHRKRNAHRPKPAEPVAP